MTADKSTCGCKVAQWKDYCGTINKTKNGMTCERWDALLLGQATILLFPNAGLDENFYQSPGAIVPH
jgi:hypothetical protein